jgi:hypothetical protein
MPKRPSLPKDPSQRAKAILDMATGKAKRPPVAPESDMASLGRLGGQKGGTARAAKLSPERRKEIARVAAASRWSKDDGGDRDPE